MYNLSRPSADFRQRSPLAVKHGSISQASEKQGRILYQRPQKSTHWPFYSAAQSSSQHSLYHARSPSKGWIRPTACSYAVPLCLSCSDGLPLLISMLQVPRTPTISQGNQLPHRVLHPYRAISLRFAILPRLALLPRLAILPRFAPIPRLVTNPRFATLPRFAIPPMPVLSTHLPVSTP